MDNIKKHKKVVLSPKAMDFELMIEEIVDHVDTQKNKNENALLNRAVAKLTDAYFFCDHNGNICLLTS